MYPGLHLVHQRRSVDHLALGFLRRYQQFALEFLCLSCGHTDNADNNAARVIKKRAIKLVMDSGTELTEKGLLKPHDKKRNQ